MITLSTNTENFPTLTLNEKATLNNPNWLLAITSNSNHNTKVIRLSGDTSLNTARYNRFPITVTGSTDENLENGIVHLEPGTYDYQAWQTSGTTLALSAATSIVESGKLEVNGTGTTTTTYTNQLTDYTFE